MNVKSLTPRLRETVALFDDSPEPHTTTEIAEQLDLGRRSTYARLERLVDQEFLETKKVGANARVWWRPQTEPSSNAQSEPDTDAPRRLEFAERGETENAFHWKTEHQELALEAADLGIFELDLRTDTSLIRSPQHDRLFGYEEPLGEWNMDRFFDHVHPDDREAALREFESARETGAWTCECRIIRADGAHRRITVDGEFVFDDDGTPVRLLGIVSDITERKEHEEELELYETIVETIDDGVYVIDEAGCFVEMNDAYVDMTGYDRDELLGAHCSLVVEECSDGSSELVDRLTTDSVDDGSLESRIRRADGTTIRVESTVAALDSEATGAKSVAVVRDITERADREHAIEQHELELERALDLLHTAERVADVGGFEIDVEEMELYRTEHLFEILHVNHDYDPSLENALRIYHEDDRQAVDEALDAAMNDGIPYQLEVRIRTPDDDVRWIYAQGIPEIVDGEVVSIRGAVQDVTERVERERELRRQRAELAALNDLNRLVSDLVDSVIEQSTRNEIEQVICDGLASMDAYEFAWVGAADPGSTTLIPRATAGTDGYVDDIIVSLDADDPRSEGPGAMAVREREIQVIQDVFTDPAFEPWRDAAAEYGFCSMASIPIVYQDTVYGTLGVYSAQENAFNDAETDVIGQLGEIVGHAIAAVERKQALMSDELVELEFAIQDVFADFDTSIEPDGPVFIENSIPISDEEFLVYGTASPEAIEDLKALSEILPHWDSVTVRSSGDPATFELRLTEQPVLSVIASLGGYVDDALLESGDFHMTIHLAPSVDVRRVTDTVEDAFSNASLVRRRQITRPNDDAQRVQRRLTSELTDRQRMILDAAYHAGYFEWPRETNGTEMADAFGVSQPTFHQHLRKAEQKVIEVLYSTQRNVE